MTHPNRAVEPDLPKVGPGSRSAETHPGTPPRPTVVTPTTSTITWADRWDHWLARWAVNRSGHRVRPGLYALGNPTPSSLVFVTANYTLSFDALRAALPGRDAYILVLNTRGINVWCAAGKGTFGTGEIATRVRATSLDQVVSHRRLILPQLGAPGVSAQEVKRRTGFRVEYGPVRAADLPEYLAKGKATPEMRRVRFGLADRLILIPVEVVYAFPKMVGAAAGLWLASGWLAAAAAVAAVLAGTVLFPIFLPWLPSRQFSVKGFFLGGLVALPYAVTSWLGHLADPLWLRAGQTLVYLLAAPPVTAYLALNFTGATPLTSRTGVKREIATYIPVMAWVFGAGLLLLVVVTVSRFLLR